jgi:uncharacterized damage-inducible protein DinB
LAIFQSQAYRLALTDGSNCAKLLQGAINMKCILIVFGIAALPLFSQSNTGSGATPENPLSMAAKHAYIMSKSDLLKSAEEMPEANYSFRPAESVRTFGQLVGHVADGQYEFCSAVVGDGKQPPGIEKTKTSKADLIQSLKDAFAYCDQAYNGMTDAQAAQVIKFFGYQAPKLSVLYFNTGHNMEHYGNMVTYLRIKGLVPPSSQNQSMQ